MKKTPLYLVLFLLVFSYTFILAAPALANCTCYCTDGSTSVVANESACGDYCNGKVPKQSMDPNKGCPNLTTDSGGGVVLKDPLNLQGDPQVFWARIIGGLLGFVGVGALITFVYAGFMFLTSSGNPEQVKKAKDTMVYAVLGVAVSMGAYVILGFIFDTLQGSVGQ